MRANRGESGCTNPSLLPHTNKKKKALGKGRKTSPSQGAGHSHTTPHTAMQTTPSQAPKPFSQPPQLHNAGKAVNGRPRHAACTGGTTPFPRASKGKKGGGLPGPPLKIPNGHSPQVAKQHRWTPRAATPNTSAHASTHAHTIQADGDSSTKQQAFQRNQPTQPRPVGTHGLCPVPRFQLSCQPPLPLVVALKPTGAPSTHSPCRSTHCCHHHQP